MIFSLVLAYRLLNRRKSLSHKYLRQARAARLALSAYRVRLYVSRGVNEHLFTSESAIDGHDPVLTATIFPHDTVDKAHMSVTLGVKHTVICSSSHSGEKFVKVIRHDFVVSLKHLFPFSFLFLYYTLWVRVLSIDEFKIPHRQDPEYSRPHQHKLHTPYRSRERLHY